MRRAGSPRERLVSGPTSSSLSSVPASLVRSLRGSLPGSRRSHPSSRPYGVQRSAADNGIDDGDLSLISRSELPINLDGPPVLSFVDDHEHPTSGVLGRLKNYSRVSLPRLGKSSRARATRVVIGPEAGHSILSQFPAPPTHIPTPIALAYTGVTAPAIVISPSSDTSHATHSSDHPSVQASLDHLAHSSPRRRRFSTDRIKAFARRAISKKEKQRQPQSSLLPLYELSAVIQKPLPELPQATAEPPPEGAVFAYSLVDPTELCASPYPGLAELLPPSTRTSFIPPSPSWLSRNVQTDVDIAPADSCARLQVPSAPTQSAPASPLPLPIPPRVYVPEFDPEVPLSPLDVGHWLTHLESYKHSHAQSQISLHSRSPSRRSSASSLSGQSSRTLSVKEETEADLPALTDAPRPLLFKPAGSSASLSFSAVHPYGSPAHCISSVSLQPRTSPPTFLQSPTLAAGRERFIPRQDSSPNVSDFPPELITAAIEAIFSAAGIRLANMDLYGGKQNDVVDFGGGTDYSNYKFFSEPPPRHEPPPPEPVTSPYIPNEDVIVQNEGFEFALKAAPNVLYSRYKQYGQLGVLAWCSEFGELIDALKALGFQGNMFVSTRTQALRTCQEILRLVLPDVQMQIIIMYLSSQVARLRRFLDSDSQWDDYPEPNFPMDPSASMKSPHPATPM